MKRSVHCNQISRFSYPRTQCPAFDSHDAECLRCDYEIARDDGYSQYGVHCIVCRDAGWVDHRECPNCHNPRHKADR